MSTEWKESWPECLAKLRGQCLALNSAEEAIGMAMAMVDTGITTWAELNTTPGELVELVHQKAVIRALDSIESLRRGSVPTTIAARIGAKIREEVKTDIISWRDIGSSPEELDALIKKATE